MIKSGPAKKNQTIKTDFNMEIHQLYIQINHKGIHRKQLFSNCCNCSVINTAKKMYNKLLKEIIIINILRSLK